MCGKMSIIYNFIRLLTVQHHLRGNDNFYWRLGAYFKLKKHMGAYIIRDGRFDTVR